MGLAIGGAVTLGLEVMFDAIEQCHVQQKPGAGSRVNDFSIAGKLRLLIRRF